MKIQVEEFLLIGYWMRKKKTDPGLLGKVYEKILYNIGDSGFNQSSQGYLFFKL